MPSRHLQKKLVFHKHITYNSPLHSSIPSIQMSKKISHITSQLILLLIVASFCCRRIAAFIHALLRSMSAFLYFLWALLPAHIMRIFLEFSLLCFFLVCFLCLFILSVVWIVTLALGGHLAAHYNVKSSCQSKTCLLRLLCKLPLDRSWHMS